MRILVITPYINVKIGPSVWAHELSKKLVDKHISTKILTIKDKDNEIPTFVHKGSKIEKKVIKYPFISITTRIIKITKKERIELVHANNPLIGGIGAVIAKKITKTPVILTLHGMYFDELNEWVNSYFKDFGKLKKPLIKISSFLLSKTGKYVLEHSDRVVVPNEYLKNYLEIRGISSIIIPNGVNPNVFNIQKNAFNCHKRKIILSISHMDIYKKASGLKILFDALNIIKNEFNVELWLVGTGKYMEDSKGYCKEKELPVKFLGYREDVPDLLNKADVYVHSSLQEVFPFTILEAMASKNPVVAIRAGGISELIKDSKNGFLCDHDPSDMAKKIGVLLKNRTIARKLVQNAFEDVLKKYTWDKVTNKYIDLYAKNVKK